MNKHTVKNIQTSLDENNKINSIIFNLISTNEALTEEVDQSWIKYFDPVLDNVQELSPEALMKICEDIALENKMYERADTILLNRTKPVLVGDPNAPLVNYLPVPTEQESRDQMVAAVDNHIAAIYDRFTRFQMEYNLREEAALKYKAADFTGDPSVWITRYADNNKITNKESAELILTQAAQYKDALEILGSLRMDKYRVINASTIQEAVIEFNKIIQESNVIDGSLS
jgi:hypothetical protein